MKKYSVLLSIFWATVLLISAIRCKPQHSDPILQSRYFSEKLSPLHLPNSNNELVEYEGTTYAICWADLNDNEYPDLYFNHHGDWKLSSFPSSHLIYDPFKERKFDSIKVIGGGDQHAALFLDLNDDGEPDLFQLHGGGRGTAQPEDTANWNGFYPSARELSKNEARNLAFEMGLADPAARAHYVYPIRIKDSLHIALINGVRADGLAKSSILKREKNIFIPAEEFIKCQGKDCLPFSLANGDANFFRWGYLNDDNLPDFLIFRQTRPYEPYLETMFRVYLSREDGNYQTWELDKEIPVKRDVMLTQMTESPTEQIIIPSHSDITIYGVINDEIERLKTFDFSRISANHFDDNDELSKKYRVRDIFVGDINNDETNEIITLHSRRWKEDQVRGNNFILIWELDKDLNLIGTEKIRLESLGCTGKNFAVADADLDGALDLLIGTGVGSPERCNGGYAFLKGKVGGNWLEIDLKDEMGLKGLGARVMVSHKDRVLMKVQNGGMRDGVQDMQRLHFGLGEAEEVTVEIHWPNGDYEKHENIHVNQLLTFSLL